MKEHKKVQILIVFSKKCKSLWFSFVRKDRQTNRQTNKQTDKHPQSCSENKPPANLKKRLPPANIPYNDVDLKIQNK